MKTIRTVAILLALVGCASATQTSFRDPAYTHHDFTKLAVFVVGIDPDHAFTVEKQVCAKLVPAQCVSGKKLLSPAGTDSPAQIGQALTKADVDGVLVVVLGDDQTASAYMGSVLPSSASSGSAQSGSASLYRNIASWNIPPQRTIEENAKAVPLYTFDRKVHAVVSLIDRSAGKTVWGGQLNVSAPGEASVLDSDFIDGTTKELATRLRENGLIESPPAPAPNGR
ncbi:MAG TPA: hypothetical protein VGM67_06195 [Gemmatimonadaceae bacterium]